MHGPAKAFLGRRPIVDRQGDLYGYELLYRASGSDDRARFDDEDSASLNVLSTLLHELGATLVLAGRRAFVNVGPRSLHETGALVLLNPRRTVLELSPAIRPDPATLARLRVLREMGFGIAVTAVPPMETLAPWLPLATHLKVDLLRVPPGQLDVFVSTLRYGPHVLIAEKVETEAQARRCADLGFHAQQGYHVGRPEVMGNVRMGVSHAAVRRVLEAISDGADGARLAAVIRLDPALCWRLLRYCAAANFGLMVTVDSLSHAIELVGTRRLQRWLQLLLSTVEEASPAAATLARSAVYRGHMLEAVGAEHFPVGERDELFLVGAFSLLPAMLMQPMDEALASLALPEAVHDALVSRQGPYGPLLDLAEALESGSAERVETLCTHLTLSSRALDRARRTAHAAVQEAAPA